MLCPRCFGQHVLSTPQGPTPCPECAGFGEIHCCDGIIATETAIDEDAETTEDYEIVELSRKLVLWGDRPRRVRR